MNNTKNRIHWLSCVLAAALFEVPGDAAVRVQGRIAAPDGTAVSGDITVVSGIRDLQTANYRADSQGRFAFDVDATSVWLIVAKADGYVSEERELRLLPALQQINLDFTLARAGVVTGYVVEETGKAVPAATLRVRYPGTRRKFEFAQESITTADSLGYFTLSAVAQNKPFVIEASAADRPFTTSAAMSFSGPVLEGVVVSLARKGQLVHGRVVDAVGSPAAGVPVRLRAFADLADFSSEDRQSPGFALIENRRTLSAGDGSYEFRGVPAGSVVLVAGRPGVPATKREDTVQPGQPLTIDLTIR